MGESVKTKKSGNMLKIIIVVFLGLILIGIAGFGGYYFAATGKISITKTTVQKESLVKEAYFLAIQDKLVNLADTDGKRYMKATITIAYDSENKKIATELTEKKDAIEDAIISIARGKKTSDFEGKGAEDLKKEIITRVNSLLKDGKITNIYYKDLLIQ